MLSINPLCTTNNLTPHMEIRKLEINSQEASELITLLNREWSEVVEFENEKFGLAVPKPIAAIENSEVIGGLSFTSYKQIIGVR